MKTHKLIQGSPAWHSHRATHFNASDAPAMMDCSPYTTRTQLLHRLKTGIAPEVNAETQRRFDDGHRFEALARPLAEEFVGQELYPVVGTEGRMSASYDGITMDHTISLEHKSLNDELRAAMVEGCTGTDLPMLYQVQNEHQCMVAKCEKVLFMASKWRGEDLVEERHCWYYPNPELAAQIEAGWAQFEIDLADYVPVAIAATVVAEPVLNLPALSIQVNGSIALVDNLSLFGAALEDYVAKINLKPVTDQDFANLDSNVKTLKRAADSLKAAESHALAQTASIDAMRRTVAQYVALADTNRLLAEKLFKNEKENRKTAIVMAGKAAFEKHMADLNTRLGRPYMLAVQADFADAAKGLKTISSIQNAVDSELARVKIESNAIADRIQNNLNVLRDKAKDHGFLFNDVSTIVHKATDDLTTLVEKRISDHQTAEKLKEEETRVRIRAEEQAKAQREAQAEAEAEIQRAQAISTKAAHDQMLARQQAKEAEAHIERNGPDSHGSTFPGHPAAGVDVPAGYQRVWSAPECGASGSVCFPANANPDDGERINLGSINEHLAPIKLDAAGLEQLGFVPVAIVKASKQYRACDLPAIRRALTEHLSRLAELQLA